MSDEQQPSVYERRGIIAVERRATQRIVTVERRKRGRPPLAEGEQSAGVCVRMPSSLYDRLFAKATEARVSLPEFVRDAIARRV